MGINQKIEQAMILLSEVLEDMNSKKANQSVLPVSNDNIKVSNGQWNGQDAIEYDFGSTTI